LGNRLPDIKETQIKLQFWEGSSQYLCVEWAKAGYSPEKSALKDLEKAAERFEMAEQLRQIEERRPSRDHRDRGKDRDRRRDRGREGEVDEGHRRY